jgi:hypothetical protein
MNSVIIKHIDELSIICQKHSVNHLYVFGSVLANRFNAQNDLDFLVEFDEPDNPVTFGLLLIKFEKELETLFDREIDAVLSRYINDPFSKKIDQTKVLIYDQRGKKIFA